MLKEPAALGGGNAVVSVGIAVIRLLRVKDSSVGGGVDKLG